MRSKHLEHKVDDRDYSTEAKNLVKPLSESQLYELYQIVINMQKRPQSITRSKELAAVQDTIENISYIDSSKLYKLRVGYRSEMARTADPRHGNSRKSSKKA